MNDSTSELCQVCSAVDFAALVWPGPVDNALVGPEPIPLGTTQDVRNRGCTCEVCKLIAMQLDLVTDPDILQDPGDQCRLLFSKFEEETVPDRSSVDCPDPETGRFLARFVTVEIVPISFAGFTGPVMPDRFYKAGEENPTTRQATVQARPWKLFYLQGCTNPVPTVDQLCAGGPELLASPKHTRFSGRLRNDVISPRLYGHWLQLCTRHHSNNC